MAMSRSSAFLWVQSSGKSENLSRSVWTALLAAATRRGVFSRTVCLGNLEKRMARIGRKCEAGMPLGPVAALAR